MEQSYVKLKIAEKEDRLRKEKEKKAMKPANGTAQKDGKYFLVRLDMDCLLYTSPSPRDRG